MLQQILLWLLEPEDLSSEKSLILICKYRDLIMRACKISRACNICLKRVFRVEIEEF